MKKINFLSLLAVAITATIISSCSSEKGLNVEKRHYRNGYSLSWNGKKQSTPQPDLNAANAQNKSEQLTAMQPAQSKLKTEIVNEPTLITASNSNVPVIAVEAKTEANAIAHKSNTAMRTDSKTVTADNIVAAEPKTYSKAERKEMKKFFTKKAPGQTDIPLWAYILFAIILPPLAVGLFEGIHGPFWLSILLTILFWFPGVIYALWRVLK